MRLQNFLFLGSLLLVGCAVGPDFDPPCPPDIESYTENHLPEKTVESKGESGGSQHFRQGEDIPGEWWDLFHSEPLNELVEKGIAQNNSLKAAQAALRVAEENYWAAFGQLFPYVSLTGSAERQRLNGAEFGSSTQPPVTFNLFNAAVNVSYILDVFGGIRRQIETTEAQEDFQRYEERATFLTLTANIVTTAITEASLREQIETTNELIVEQKKNLDISQKRFDFGAISKIDVLAQATQLYQTEATLPPLQNALAETRTALAVLVGELPSESKIPDFSLSKMTLPIEIPLSVPCQLVSQRPDVKAAEAQLHAACAQIGVATANILPQFTITGSYGGSSNFIQDLFEKRSNIWTIIGNVAQPIFDGGTLFAKREAAIAAFEQAYAQYNDTVLNAYKNVADALQALQFDAVQLQITTEAENAAHETLRLTEIQYDLGAVSYLALIIAQRQNHLARIARIKAQASRYRDTAALFQALGGGWWNRTCKKEDEPEKT